MILPKRLDVEKAKVQERQREIESGLTLARKVDELRSILPREEKNLKVWRDTSITKVLEEINELVTKRDEMFEQERQARIRRDELLQPLNHEWDKLRDDRETVEEARRTTKVVEEFLAKEAEKIKKQVTRNDDITSRLRRKETEIEQTKAQANSYYEMAKKEFQAALFDRQRQEDAHEKDMSNLSSLRQQYESGLVIVEQERQEVKQKEADLIKRESHLASQQRQLQIAQEQIKYGKH